ncbi:hypothetical protein SEA_NANOSMITE_93 [Mycobacterium phage Nanosmite]|nr:hypothetical protein SEA_NANOSMITE_93 [Mycobacterium phage Nanosmite]
MATKKQRAREKYKARYGYEPSTDSALISFMATMPASDFSGCSDYSSYSPSSYDSGSSYSSFDSGSSFDGGSCSF